MPNKPKGKKWVKSDDGRLTSRERKDLPRSDFALPGKGEGPQGKGSGSYPINDISHARNALARVAQHGTPEDKKRVRAAVNRKYPSIQVGGGKSPLYDKRKDD